MNESFRAQTYGYIASNESIGTVYDKALYRRYTGPDFTERTEQPDWLGFNGPILCGEVNAMIELVENLSSLPECSYAVVQIMFIDRMDNFYASMHSMGLFYTKESKGSIYYNGTESNAEGNTVPPGGCVVYKWQVASFNTCI